MNRVLQAESQQYPLPTGTVGAIRSVQQGGAHGE